MSICLFAQEDDIQYEEDIMRNMFNVKSWLRYLDHKKSASPLVRFLIYERAVKELPGRFWCTRDSYVQLHAVVSILG